VRQARLYVRADATDITVSITETARERMRGLLGRDHLPRDEALLLEHCGSVHTFGMRFAIDVVLLDRRERVIAIHRNVPRRRMVLSLRATQALEMRAGTAHLLGLSVGDPLVFEALT
jgi:uncharacterized membrane protein (UPF0127 family)